MVEINLVEDKKLSAGTDPRSYRFPLGRARLSLFIATESPHTASVANLGQLAKNPSVTLLDPFWFDPETRQELEGLLAHFGVRHFPVLRQQSGMAECPEYSRLHSEVENVLGNLAQVITTLLELFRSKDLNGVHRLDKELELTVGEKERRLGALRQHIKEHNCVTPL